MASAEDLTELHRAQLTRFALFFKGKRDKTLSDRRLELEDFKSDRLSDDQHLLTAAESQALFDYYHEQLEIRFREDLEHCANLSGAYVVQLLAQAQRYGFELNLDDISVIEDQYRLNSVQALSALQGAPPPMPKPRAALPTLGATGADPQALQQIQDLKADNEQMLARYQQMQLDNAALLKERSELQQAMGQLVADAQAGGQYEQTLQGMKDMLDSKQYEIDQLRQEQMARLGESAQFVQLKDLLKKKSTQLKELKQVCAHYNIPIPAEEGGIELEADD